MRALTLLGQLIGLIVTCPLFNLLGPLVITRTRPRLWFANMQLQLLWLKPPIPLAQKQRTPLLCIKVELEHVLSELKLELGNSVGL